MRQSLQKHVTCFGCPEAFWAKRFHSELLTLPDPIPSNTCSQRQTLSSARGTLPQFCQASEQLNMSGLVPDTTHKAVQPRAKRQKFTLNLCKQKLTWVKMFPILKTDFSTSTDFNNPLFFLNLALVQDKKQIQDIL